MAYTDIAYPVLAWAFAFTCAFCVAVYYHRERNLVRLVSGSFLAGIYGFAAIAYLVHNSDGVDGSEWYYLFIAIAVGSFSHKIFEFIEKRSDQVFDAIWKKLGLPDDERKCKTDDLPVDDSDVNDGSSGGAGEDAP